MVVHDHVAFLDRLAEPIEEAADVPGKRPDVHRRRVRLAELAPLRVEDAGAEILGLADDRRVAHAEEDARHLLRDGVEGAAEHPQRDRVDLDPPARNHASPSWRSAASGDSEPAGDSGARSFGCSPMPRTRRFGISTSDSSKRREYSRSWMSSKSLRKRRTHASSIAPAPQSTRSS